MQKDQLNAHIGKKLKQLRSQKGLNLEETATMTGVSKPMLGQIERGDSNPTVGTLWKVANGLNVPFTSFVELDRPSITKITYDELKTLDGDHGGFHVKPLFSKDSYTPFEVFYVDIDPQQSYYSNAHPDGVEEYIFLQKGYVEIAIENHCFELKTGDALRFQASEDHVYTNKSDEKASFTMIIYYS
ncbi:helix-turn-helix domain-containing protein [Salibacterium salarium]|uniref:helix-turn-helix domain-containing protein n=1 Tax=Salibacterium salarium TaxID=284579 RepID=UPI000F7A1CBE|nr:XRE family transcriptional regulator [Salibacterium salarium]